MLHPPPAQGRLHWHRLCGARRQAGPPPWLGAALLWLPRRRRPCLLRARHRPPLRPHLWHGWVGSSAGLGWALQWLKLGEGWPACTAPSFLRVGGQSAGAGAPVKGGGPAAPNGQDSCCKGQFCGAVTQFPAPAHPHPLRHCRRLDWGDLERHGGHRLLLQAPLQQKAIPLTRIYPLAAPQATGLG